MGIIELVGVTDPFVRRQFKILSAKGMTVPGGEVCKRHLVRPANSGIHFMNLARKAVRWKPLGHCIGIQECSINPFRSRAKHTVKSDGIWHDASPFRCCCEALSSHKYIPGCQLKSFWRAPGH